MPTEPESQYDAFLAGFRDALPLEHRGDWQWHYNRWQELEPMNDIELIDYMTAGYVTGLETGNDYARNHL